MEPLVYCQAVGNTGDNLGLQLASEVELGALWWDRALSLWDLMLYPGGPHQN